MALTTSKNTKLLASTVLAIFAVSLFISQTYANPIGLHVGDKITIVSSKGVAYTKENGAGKRYEAGLRLEGVVTAAEERSISFDIKGGTIKIGDQTYNVNSGKGQLHFNKDDAKIRLGGAGQVGGQKFEFKLYGYGEIKEGAIQLKLHGGLAAGDTRFKLAFRASLDKA